MINKKENHFKHQKNQLSLSNQLKLFQLINNQKYCLVIISELSIQSHKIWIGKVSSYL